MTSGDDAVTSTWLNSLAVGVSFSGRFFILLMPESFRKDAARWGRCSRHVGINVCVEEMCCASWPCLPSCCVRLPGHRH